MEVLSCKRRALAQRECPKGSGCVKKRLRLLREGLKLEQRAQIELLHKEGAQPGGDWAAAWSTRDDDRV